MHSTIIKGTDVNDGSKERFMDVEEVGVLMFDCCRILMMIFCVLDQLLEFLSKFYKFQKALAPSIFDLAEI